MSSPQDNFTIFINGLINIIKEVFKNYNDKDTEDNHYAPTEHLNANVETLKTKGLLNLFSSGTNETIYDAGQIEGDFHIYVTMSNTGFTVAIKNKNGVQEAKKINNFSISSNGQKDNKDKMYVYGVRANGDRPKISGTVLNKAAFDICEAMHIPELMISDSAGVPCHYDETIELDHFSILRVMAGKKSGKDSYIDGPGDTFYQSLTGHFLNEDAAVKEKQTIYDAINVQERVVIRDYLNSLKSGDNLSAKKDVCNEINVIINKGKAKEILSYVATPYLAAAVVNPGLLNKEEAEAAATKAKEEAEAEAAAKKAKEEEEAAARKAKEETDRASTTTASASTTTSAASIFVKIDPSNNIEILNTLNGEKIESISFDSVIKTTRTSTAYVAIQILKQTCVKPDYCITFNGENYEMQLDKIMNNIGTPVDDAFLSLASSSSFSSSSSSSGEAATSSGSSSPSNKAEDTYIEKQEKQLCGKHALNHLLQEEKIVWVPNNKSTLLTEGGKTLDIKDKDTKYNLWNLCEERKKNGIESLKLKFQEENLNRIQIRLIENKPQANDQYYKTRGISNLANDINDWNDIHKKYKKSDGSIMGQDEILNLLIQEHSEPLSEEEKKLQQTTESICDPNGNVPFDWFVDIFNALDYEAKHVIKDYQTQLESAMNEPNYLGFFINQGAWHYVSSPKYSNFENNCEFVIADSLGPKYYTCYKSKDAYYNALKDLKIQGGYLIFANKPDAYQSVAVERMKKASAAVSENEQNADIEADKLAADKLAADRLEAASNKGGKSLKAPKKKNKRTKRKYYVYNK